MSFSKLTAAALLALSTLTTAVPTPGPNAPPALSPDEYYLGLKAPGYSYLTLNIEHIGAGESQGFFERPSVYPGTPAYLNDTYLNFDVGVEIPYSGYFAEVGDNYGTKTPFYAAEGGNVGRKGFAITADGTLSAELHSAEEHFFACNTTVEGNRRFGLFWGVFQTDGSAPEDCVTATIIATKKTY